MTSSNTIFQFKEIDPEGFETLQVIADAVNFNRWTYDVIAPFCKGRVLEVGSGIGNISEQFVANNFDITLSDIRKNYRDYLQQKFPKLAEAENILPIDLVHPEFETEYSALTGKFDTVFALNVVEHIENDSQAVANCYRLLKPGGILILLMPAHQKLYNTFDRELLHFKRYNRTGMEQLLASNGFNVRQTYYFNASGIPGWFISGKLQKNRTIPKSQMLLFNFLVPFFRIIDKILFNQVGLSVIGVGMKPDPATRP